jgi:hypothetical protein
MEEQPRAGRQVVRAAGWIAAIAVGVGVYLAYRWAEPSPASFTASNNLSARPAGIRLENAPFTGYAQGQKAWSLWAKQIDLQRAQGAALGDIQSADLTDIRNGVLYQLPPEAAGLEPVSASSSGTAVSPASARPPDKRKAAPYATFRAKHGHYTAGAQSSLLPPEMMPNYLVQWQFTLTDDVELRTRTGDRLRADSLTILQLWNRRTRRQERRITCDAGARVTREDVTIQANKARYDPAERVVECLGGVRGTFKGGMVQTERAFWSLKDHMLRCPETTAGRLRDMPFQTDNLTVDLKRGLVRANHVAALLRMEGQEETGLGLP